LTGQWACAIALSSRLGKKCHPNSLETFPSSSNSVETLISPDNPYDSSGSRLTLSQWIEVNIRVRKWEQMNEVLLSFVDVFVRDYLGKLKLWHFLREPSPVTGGPEIQLRILLDDKDIQSVKLDLEARLQELEKNESNVYSSHVFGAHGVPGNDYGPELERFGTKGWEIFADFLMKTSETAIRFLRDEPLGAGVVI
jgi:hypothetical protein